MIDSQRRDEILQAEAVIRQMAEKMAENMASRVEAKDVSSAFWCANEALTEANLTLSAFVEKAKEQAKDASSAFWCANEALAEINLTLSTLIDKAKEEQTTLSKGQADWCQAAAYRERVWETIAKNFGNEAARLQSNSEESQTRLDTSLNCLASQNEKFSRSCTSLEDKIATHHRNLEERLDCIAAQNEEFSRTCASFEDRIATNDRNLHENYEKHDVRLQTSRQYVVSRIYFSTALCMLFLIAILIAIAKR